MTKIAVIQTGGKQYRIQEDQVISIEKLPQEKDTNIVFDQVLLISDKDGKNLQIGTPFLDAKVEATVLDHGREKKVNVVKYKPKIRYKKTTGHRQHFTKVKITKIP